MKHLGKILIAAGALALGSMSHAAVVTWDVITSGTWTAYAPNAGVTRSADLKTLSWGNVAPANQSSLVITNPGTQSIQTFT